MWIRAGFAFALECCFIVIGKKCIFTNKFTNILTTSVACGTITLFTKIKNVCNYQTILYFLTCFAA